MIRAVIDTNIILDIALKRDPYFEFSSRIFDIIDDQLLEGYITASSITDIYYIASKQKDKIQAKNFLLNLIQILEILGVDKDIIIESLNSDLSDFEDAVQVYTAKSNAIDLIITRNVVDFANSGMRAVTPEDFILQIEKG
jgi:predicted nucleic acid-binding protein